MLAAKLVGCVMSPKVPAGRPPTVLFNSLVAFDLY
jgi:hypothetical protein